MKVRYRALALADLENIFQFLNERSPSRGSQCASRNPPMRLRRLPRIRWRRRGRPIRRLRVKILGRYRYKIFYAVDGDIIDIIHIRHGARRPWIAP